MSPDRAAAAVFDSALPGARHSNAFLENGARLYLDTGSHPEYATPECDDLAELVAHDKAGERIVEDLVRRAERGLRADGIIGRLLVFKNNTDSVGNSYGCHENYLVSRNVPLQRLAEVLIPFLVTRQVFAGAGKVLRTPRGVRYCLSQRAPHICQDICAATTSGRSIINMRDEPLADAERYRRLHLIVGDSNMAEVATYLKVGTTALILDMIEDGSFDRDYSLRSPVQALRDISSDPTLGATVELKDGRTMNALQLQTEYLEGVARHVSSTGANRAAKDVLARWADVIERLRDDPMQLNRELDWVIKLEWIEHYRTRDRLSWCDPKISLIDLQYHDVRHECGIYYRLAAHGRVERVIDDAAIATAIQIPPQTTRARLRGEFIRQARLKGRDYRADWTYLKLEGSGSRAIHCKDPFRAHDDEIERIIESL